MTKVTIKVAPRAETGGQPVARFPKEKLQPETIGKKDTEQKLKEKLGNEATDTFFRLIRIPDTVKFVLTKTGFEIYEVSSTRPPTTYDSASTETIEDALKWVGKWYLSISDSNEKTTVRFIDKTRTETSTGEPLAFEIVIGNDTAARKPSLLDFIRELETRWPY